MKFIKQKETLSVKNVDNQSNNYTNNSKHGSLLPNDIRCIICGPSNCGKTNVMFNLIEHPNGLRFKNIYIYSKSLYQPKYKILQQIIKNINGMGYYTYTDNEEIIRPENANPNSIFIFDDVACDKQNNIRNFFSMGRHNLIDSFYLCQTYSKIPKQLIRDNTNFIILFKQDDLNLKHIYDDHVNFDFPSFLEFKQVCNLCWDSNKYSFMVIDKNSDLNKGRYRKGFDMFLDITK